MPNSSIKNEKVYEELRRDGNSKQKSARIANATARASTTTVGRRGGTSKSYDYWTVGDLKQRAKELGLHGYSRMTKDRLISELRNH
jgi:hypothetical protein